MKPIDRRAFLQGAAYGTGLIAISQVFPGCAGAVLKAPKVSSGSGGGCPFWGLFGVTEETTKKTIARALQNGGDFAEVFFGHSMGDSLKLEEGIVNVASAYIDMGAGVRVVVGDQVGYAYTESLTEEALLNAAATASMIARSKAQGELPDFKAVEVKSRYPVKYSPVEYPVADKMELIRRVDKAARAKSQLTQVVISYHNSEYERVIVARSDGRIVWDTRPRINLGCYVSVKKGDRTERNFYAEGGKTDQDFYKNGRPEKIAAEAVKRAEICLEAVTPPAGEMPVVLAPGDSGILLHEAIGHGLEADFNRKNISIYAGRIGEKVASELCTVIDDGTIIGADGSLTVDDEGNDGGKNTLIDKGVLVGYMHDEISARHYKVKPTGNGRRQSFRHPPIPRMTNTMMVKGPHSKEEVFEGIERGIYAITFTNGQVHIGPGDYTFFVNYGYLIENGKLTSPIKDVNIIGNGPESLSRVDRVGDDVEMPEAGQGYCGKAGQRVPVNYGVPHIRISKVTVGGRTQS